MNTQSGKTGGGVLSLLVGGLSLLFAVPMVIIGILLAAKGGSLYYLIAGVVFAIAAVQVLRARLAGYYLYLAAFAGTIIWGFWEVGAHALPLLPRLLAFAVILLISWLGWGSLGPRLQAGAHSWRPVGIGVVVVAVATLIGFLAFSHGPQDDWLPNEIAADGAQPPHIPTPELSPATLAGEWRHYGNEASGERYSPLTQITPANVGKLQRAWVVHTGATPTPSEGPPREFTAEQTPLKVGDRLVLCTPHAQVEALDPATGKRIWTFDPKQNIEAAPFITCRGVSYDETPNATGLCAKRVLFATITAKLYALDLESGQRCPEFGHDGEVDLTEGMGGVKPGFYFVSSPPSIVHGKAVLGGWVYDNHETGEPSGVVRAFDTRTGQLAWAFDMGRPDRTTLPPPGEHYTRQTPNAWAPISADPKLGLVYLPTGNQTPDFFGGNGLRMPVSERYASSIIAVDADTGRMRWAQQTTHHDVWDYDIPDQPVLTDIPAADGGAPTPGVVVPTKRGEVFVFDRRDGRPLNKIEERAVPQDAVAGDKLAPTQPFPDFPSLRPPKLSEAQMWGTTPIDQALCRLKFREAKYEGDFTPPSTQGSILYPSSIGVFEWGGVSVDPRRGVLYANTSWLAMYNKLVPRAKAEKLPPQSTQADIGGPMKGTPYAAIAEPFLSVMRIPCWQPPWGHITAIDLATKKILWRDVLGTAYDNGPFGIPMHLPLKVGVPNVGGSVVTAGGLIFVAATADKTFRAFDAATGKQLWQDHLPNAGNATPSVYSVNGEEYVVISAGGHGGMSSTLGDEMIAYKLPSH